jgi:hypothetical protein
MESEHTPGLYISLSTDESAVVITPILNYKLFYFPPFSFTCHQSLPSKFDHLFFSSKKS